jgi:hypothetical protein
MEPVMSLPHSSRTCDSRPCRFLTALPVFNEVRHVTPVLDQVVKYATDVLVVDDGSSDGTRELLAQREDIKVIYHPQNRGYGAALKTAFDYAIENDYELVVTIDCDGQHEPQRICDLAKACRHFDIASGSRYLETPASTDQVPSDRLSINRTITHELNELLGLNLTDAFCGFKAYRASAIAKLKLTKQVMRCRWSCGSRRVGTACESPRCPCRSFILTKNGASAAPWMRPPCGSSIIAT